MSKYLDEFRQLGKPGGCTRDYVPFGASSGLDVAVDVTRGAYWFVAKICDRRAPGKMYALRIGV